MENLVIGGGLAGLIYAFYNKDFKVFADRIGGQSSGGFTLGPRIIQKHEATKKLLTDLGYKTFCNFDLYDYRKSQKPMLEKWAKIGYYENNKIVDNPSEEFRKKYYLKSRCLVSSKEVPESVMSDNKQTISYYVISHEKLASLIVERLQKENRLFVAKVDQVELSENLLHVNSDGKLRHFQFDKLVNTTPFPVFFKLCNPGMQLSSNSFEYEPKFFITLDKYDFKDLGEQDCYDYIYFAGEEPFHRITVGKTEVVVECTGKTMYEEFHRQYSHLQWSVQELKIGQIKRNFCAIKMEVDGIEIPNVRNFGRFAQWDHSIKTQQCVEMAQKDIWK